VDEDRSEPQPHRPAAPYDARQHAPGQPGQPGPGQHRGDQHGVGPYGPPPWAPFPPWQEDPRVLGRSRAETALVLGILSVVTLPLLGPFAIWQANEAEKLGVPAPAGRILGWVGTVLLGLMLVFLGIWITAMLFLVTSNGG
jgi:hypothetical protein